MHKNLEKLETGFEGDIDVILPKQRKIEEELVENYSKIRYRFIYTDYKNYIMNAKYIDKNIEGNSRGVG